MALWIVIIVASGLGRVVKECRRLRTRVSFSYYYYLISVRSLGFSLVVKV